MVSKDTNVMLVTIAAKCIMGLAKGLRKGFSQHAPGVSYLVSYSEQVLCVTLSKPLLEKLFILSESVFCSVSVFMPLLMKTVLF